MTPLAFRCSARKSLLLAAAITLLLTANLASAIAADTQWEKLEGCKLLRAPNNDGDSFYVEHKGKELQFRLYFVDAPETNKRYPDRVKEQAAYWDISEEQALQIGAQASKFSAELLKKGFTILTKREDARGQSRIQRFYAIVKIATRIWRRNSSAQVLRAFMGCAPVCQTAHRQPMRHSN
jgi:endonuclease YncB( thermonuclease family)